MKYRLARVKRLIRQLASPRGMLVLLTMIAVAVALLAPSATIRVAAVLVAIACGGAFALLLGEGQAGAHQRLRQREVRAAFESANLDAVAAVKGHEPDPTRRLVLPSLLELPDSDVAGKVILLPAASYHVDETGPICVELERMGFGSVVMANDSTGR